VDRERVPARARLADPDRRVAGRHLRRAPRVRYRRRVVRSVLTRLRARPDDRDADRGSRLARSSRSAARPGLSRPHRRGLPGQGARRSNRRLDGLGSDRLADRPACGRCDRRPALVALDLRTQHPVGRSHLAPGQSRSRADVARHLASCRLPRRRSLRSGARRRRFRLDRAASPRLVERCHPRTARRRRPHVRRLPRLRATGRAADARASPSSSSSSVSSCSRSPATALSRPV
jgi:hypothetical protein